MSAWTHHLCGQCYEAEEPGREPARVLIDNPGPCCLCGRITVEGIYYRADPRKLRCKGKHEREEE